MKSSAVSSKRRGVRRAAHFMFLAINPARGERQPVEPVASAWLPAL